MRIAVCLLCLVLGARAEKWPFGDGDGFSRKDLFNLGLLGAKASDADKAPAKNEPPRGGRRSVQMDRPTNDDGPERLRIELVMPGGPAEKAGLVPGDIIVGAGGKSFAKGSLAAMAKVLLKAEASKGVVTLKVKRQGVKGTTKISVEVPVAGKAAAKPPQGAGRKALLDGALKWLAERQSENGGYKETLSGKNGAVIQASLAGLAWLGGGSDLENGAYKDNVKRVADWVGASVRQLGDELGGSKPGGPSWNQANWGYAHAAIFLGELHKRTPRRGDLDALEYCAKRLVETQEKSGGWAHGPGGKNALGYLELNIVTGLALCGLGLAHRNGFAVPEKTLALAEEYLKKSSGGGGIGYSTMPGQQGQGNIGRTAAAWLGYKALGKAKSGWGKKMGSYVKRNAGKALGGHASLMQHIFFAGVAAHAQGGAATKDFWKSMQRDLVLARTPDGSFQPRPWHESVSMSSNSDVTFGEVWTTATWAMILASERSREGATGYPAWFGE